MHVCSLQRSALLFSLLLALHGCGGGGGDGAAAPSPAPPAPAPAPTPPTLGGGTTADVTCGFVNFEADALRLVNQYRAAGASCGAQGTFAPAAALASNARLVSAAYGHSKDMADNNYFSHTSLDGRQLSDRINAVGYAWSTIGENIAAGQGSVQQVIDGWMASDGHCANIMNPRFTEIGLACARNASSTYRIYWTMDLGRP